MPASGATTSRLFSRRSRSASLRLWSLINPLVLMGIYVLVFSLLWKVAQMEHYALYLLVGLTVWLFFSTSLTTASRSLLDSAALIRKVRFPRQLVPMSVVATQLVAFVAMFAVLVVVNLIVIPETRDVFLIALPIAAVEVAFVAGVALAIACANVLFRDVEHLISAALLPWFFLTPILYRLEDLPGGVKQYDWVVTILRWVNPITPAIEALRAPLFYGNLPNAWDVVYVLAEAAIALALGAGWVFSRVDDQIAVELVTLTSQSARSARRRSTARKARAPPSPAATPAGPRRCSSARAVGGETGRRAAR